MEKHLQMGDRHIAYTLRKSKNARMVRLSVYPGGRLIATLPQGTSERVIEDFIRAKERWVLKMLARVPLAPQPKLPRVTRGQIVEEKRLARELVEYSIAKFSAMYTFSFNRISIKRQKTLWGSCSKKGNLNFNAGIIHLPEVIAEYIVVHELCHLQELNHSKKFWQLVERIIPDHKAARAFLKLHPIVKY